MTSALSIGDVADRYGVSVRTVRAWIAAGDLAAVDVSRRVGSRRPRVRITADALAAWEALRSVSPASPARTRRRHRAEEAPTWY